MKPYYSIPNFCTTLYSTAINFISNRDCSSPYCRSKYQSRFLYGNSRKKPYIALNLETYINICQQKLTSCKRIGYEFYCKELFVLRHKSIHSCESAIYFDLDTDIIKTNCDFVFYYNKSMVRMK